MDLYHCREQLEQPAYDRHSHREKSEALLQECHWEQMSNANGYERVCEIVEVGLPVFQGTVQRPVQVSKKVKGGGFWG